MIGNRKTTADVKHVLCTYIGNDILLAYFIYWFKSNLDRNTMHPKFDLTEVRTHDLQIMDSIFHVLTFGVMYYHALFYARKSNIGPQIKWAVSLVVADGHLIFLRGLCAYVWVNMLTLSPPKVFWAFYSWDHFKADHLADLSHLHTTKYVRKQTKKMLISLVF